MAVMTVPNLRGELTHPELAGPLERRSVDDPGGRRRAHPARGPREATAELRRSVEGVECAFDGHDALVKASAQAYDAIFLDVRMPDLDGRELVAC